MCVETVAAPLAVYLCSMKFFGCDKMDMADPFSIDLPDFDS